MRQVTPRTGTWGLTLLGLTPTPRPQTPVLGFDPSRADTHTQAPDTEDLGVPLKSCVKTGLTGSGLQALVKDQAGNSALATAARSSLPQPSWGRPMGCSFPEGYR